MHQNFVFYITALIITATEGFTVNVFYIFVSSVDFDSSVNLDPQCNYQFANKKC